MEKKKKKSELILEEERDGEKECVKINLSRTIKNLRINLLWCGVRSHSEDSILTLKPHLLVRGKETWCECGNTHAQVDIVSVLELLGRPAGDPLPPEESLALLLATTTTTTIGGTGFLPQLHDLEVLLRGGGHDTVDVDTGEVDLHGVQLADLDNVLGLDDGEAGGLGHDGAKGTGGVAEDAVAGLVGLPGAQDGHVAGQGRLHEVRLAVEDARLARPARLEHPTPLTQPYGDLARLDVAVGARRGEEGRDAAPRGAQPLGQRALRTQLDGDLAREVLLLQDLVAAQVAQHQAIYLPVLGEHREPAFALHAGIVGDCRQRVKVLASAPVEGGDERLGYTTETESGGQKDGARGDVGHGGIGVWVQLGGGAVLGGGFSWGWDIDGTEASCGGEKTA